MPALDATPDDIKSHRNKLACTRLVKAVETTLNKVMQECGPLGEPSQMDGVLIVADEIGGRPWLGRGLTATWDSGAAEEERQRIADVLKKHFLVDAKNVFLALVGTGVL